MNVMGNNIIHPGNELRVHPSRACLDSPETSTSSLILFSSLRFAAAHHSANSASQRIASARCIFAHTFLHSLQWPWPPLQQWPPLRCAAPRTCPYPLATAPPLPALLSRPAFPSPSLVFPPSLSIPDFSFFSAFQAFRNCGFSPGARS